MPNLSRQYFRAPEPRPGGHEEVHEVRPDEFVFLGGDDLPVLEMTELAPGVWGLPPVEFR